MHDGASYEGNWKDGTFHGHGVWTWRDGRQFQGDFKRDHPVEGVLTHEGTDRFVRWDLTSGTFVDPRPAAAAGIGGGGGSRPPSRLPRKQAVESGGVEGAPRRAAWRQTRLRPLQTLRASGLSVRQRELRSLRPRPPGDSLLWALRELTTRMTRTWSRCR